MDDCMHRYPLWTGEMWCGLVIDTDIDSAVDFKIIHSCKSTVLLVSFSILNYIIYFFDTDKLRNSTYYSCNRFQNEGLI